MNALTLLILNRYEKKGRQIDGMLKDGIKNVFVSRQTMRKMCLKEKKEEDNNPNREICRTFFLSFAQQHKNKRTHTLYKCFPMFVCE